MSNISAADVKALREKTGAGMSDCKKALEESQGDYDTAIDWLKKRGQKLSMKRADKEANEGLIFAAESKEAKKAAMIVLACETDFVAKTDEFKSIGSEIANIVLKNTVNSIDELLALKYNANETVLEVITNFSAKVGEKIQIGAMNVIERNCPVVYIHSGDRLGVLLSISGVDSVGEIGRDIAMQIAAMNPIAISMNHIDPKTIEKEMEIAREKANSGGKPAEMVEKIAQGMVNKVLEQNTLLSQSFIKNGDMTVEQYLNSNLKGATVEKFFRLSIG